MTYEIRTFGEIDANQDSIVGNTAPLGELSTYSLSFSPDKTEINSPAYTGVSGVVFSCRRDEVEVGSLPDGATDAMMAVLHALVNTIDPTIPFADQLPTVFPGIAATMTYSDFVTFNGKTIPGYISWQDTLSGDDITFKLWIADAVFRKQYDLYEIRVVPPVPNLADLRGTETALIEARESYGEEAKLNDIETARDNDAITKLAGLTLNWVSPINGATLNLTWRLVTMGPQGLERVNQIQAVRKYINDVYGDFNDGWGDIFPELDVTTTFTILPMWDKVALRSSGSTDYVLSPVIRRSDFYTGMTKRLGEEVDADTLEQLIYAQSLYNSIGFIVHTEPNGANPIPFDSMYPDFSLVPVNDINLNRLRAVTRDAMVAIETGLRIAETYESGDSLPTNYWVEVEDHLAFVCYTTNTVTHRIATRNTYLG